MIPQLDLQKLRARDPQEMAALTDALRDVGVLTLSNTGLSDTVIKETFDAYRLFFHQPDAEKREIDMSRTGSNRGWGASGSEQVDPTANPDYKQVFDCGHELAANDPMHARKLAVYAPNLWPNNMPEFREAVQTYYRHATAIAMDLLRAMASAIGRDPQSFDEAFNPPMSLLRGNYYPARPAWAGEKDFGIAAHTDYGCLTLLAVDGTPGLEVRMKDGSWQSVVAEPGQFVVNFGEMFEMWTEGRVKATLHRVIGGSEERLSIPLFFNPSFDTNVAPPESGRIIAAGDHLSKRYAETYVHLADAADRKAS